MPYPSPSLVRRTTALLLLPLAAYAAYVPDAFAIAMAAPPPTGSGSIENGAVPDPAVHHPNGFERQLLPTSGAAHGRKPAPAGPVVPANKGAVAALAGKAGTYGSTDGAGPAARFASPTGVAVDATGTVYVADRYNQTIRKISPAGVVTTLAGKAGARGGTDGAGPAARFTSPTGVAVDAAGNVYVADPGTHTIRKITAAGVVSTLAGQAGAPGMTDGAGPAARFNEPMGVAVDAAGTVYVADNANHTIRKITSAGVVSTWASLPGTDGSTDGPGPQARFYYPEGVAVDAAGTVYVADQRNATIRKISPAGVVSTLAGLANNSGSTDGLGEAARFNNPVSVAVSAAGTLYVADQGNNTIRQITPAGAVTTLAGKPGTSGSTDGPGPAAAFHFPTGVAVDAAGTVYVADRDNHTIRIIK